MGYVTYPTTNPGWEISTILLCSYTVGYVTYPTTNPGWEISTILLCSYTVGYVTYPTTNPDGKSQQSCCVPTLWDMSPILQPILMGNLNNPVVFLHCGICHLSCNQSKMGNLNNPVVFLHCGICHLSCNQSKMGNLNNPVVFLHCGICHLLLDGKSQQSCCVPTP